MDACLIADAKLHQPCMPWHSKVCSIPTLQALTADCHGAALCSSLIHVKGDVMHVCVCLPAGAAQDAFATRADYFALQASINALITDNALQKAKRQRTVTDAAAVGGIILEANKLTEQILPLGNTPMPSIVNDAFKAKWRAAGCEKDIQVWGLQ